MTVSAFPRFRGGGEDGLWRGMSMRPVVVAPWCDTACAGGPPRARSRSPFANTAADSSTRRLRGVYVFTWGVFTRTSRDRGLQFLIVRDKLEVKIKMKCMGEL